MHIKDFVLFVHSDSIEHGFTNHTCPNVGIFTIHGFKPSMERLEPHPIVLADILFDGHALLVNVGYGDTNRFTIENISEAGAIFSYKHSGQSKKSFRPGEIISPPETHNLLWDSRTAQGNLVTVILTLIPLYAKNGVQLFYTLSAKT